MTPSCEFVVTRDGRPQKCAQDASGSVVVLNTKRQQVKVLCCDECRDKVRSGMTPQLPHQHR